MNAHTTICLVPRTNQTDYVEFIRDGNGNWAHIGRIGGKQLVSMEDDNMAVVMHEIMHALGFHHTQYREDRDKYVTINMNNVQKGQEHNFHKNTDPQTNLGAYDYNSIMHYFSSAFANRQDVKTIVRKDGKTDEMGKFDGMSKTDVDNIAAVYAACSGKAVKPLPGTATTSTTPTTTQSTPNPTPVTACGLTIKYQKYMTPGSSMSEHEALVSANGRYQFRNNDGKYVIEEILNRNNCEFKEVYNFTLVVTLSPYAAQFNGGKRGFSYTKDGDIVYIPNISLGVFSDNPKNPSNHKDSPKVDVRNKSTKLELTNDGILRLVNNSGQVIWTTTK